VRAPRPAGTHDNAHPVEAVRTRWRVATRGAPRHARKPAAKSRGGPVGRRSGRGAAWSAFQTMISSGRPRARRRSDRTQRPERTKGVILCLPAIALNNHRPPSHTGGHDRCKYSPTIEANLTHEQDRVRFMPPWRTHQERSPPRELSQKPASPGSDRHVLTIPEPAKTETQPAPQCTPPALH